MWEKGGIFSSLVTVPLVSCSSHSVQTLSTLIRMCKKDRTLEENVEGAETLAYLIEEDATLQTLASISDHIIKTLADYLRYTSVQQINTRSTNKKVSTCMYMSVAPRYMYHSTIYTLSI